MARASAAALLLRDKSAREEMRDAMDEASRRAKDEAERKRVRNERLAMLIAVGVAAKWLAPRLTKTLAGEREATRAAARSRLKAELAAAGVAAQILAADPVVAAIDAERAESAAETLASAWRAAATAQAVSGRSVAKATEIVGYRVDRTASTEIATAYNEESKRAWAKLSAQYGALVVRVWDATLDKRTCSVCESRHGKEIEDDEPPAHAGCRCFARIEAR